MSFLNPIFALAVFAIAWLTAFVIQWHHKPDFSGRKFESIDGLRGFLALGVFIHHATIWRQYLLENRWDSPDSNLYSQLGSTSVSLFFMITSFLFVSKLLDSRETEFNWRRFFIGRFYRLAPMYYVSVAIIMVIVMVRTDGQLRVPFADLFESVVHWLFFTISRMPDINGLEATGIINGYVFWSLPLEWLFYFGLPLLGLLLLKIKPAKIYLVAGLLFGIGYFFGDGAKFYPCLSFMGGAIAAFLNQKERWRKWATSTYASWLLLGCLALLLCFRSTDSVLGKIAITVCFSFIALGNTIFGLLQNSTLKLLGEISYSTYLLHGIVLFVTINECLTPDVVKNFSGIEYWMMVFTLTPIVVVGSYLGFRFVEKPFIDRSKSNK